jgi:hypothetical protein
MQGKWYWLIFAARSYITLTRTIRSQSTTTKEFNMQKLAGKVAVITGGGSGIGACYRQALCQRGSLRLHYGAPAGGAG